MNGSADGRFQLLEDGVYASPGEADFFCLDLVEAGGEKDAANFLELACQYVAFRGVEYGVADAEANMIAAPPSAVEPLAAVHLDLRAHTAAMQEFLQCNGEVRAAAGGPLLVGELCFQNGCEPVE